jgi:hypothetical protein
MNGEKRNAYRLSVDYIKMDIGEREDGVVLTGFICGPMESSCDHGNEPSSSISCRKVPQ